MSTNNSSGNEQNGCIQIIVIIVCIFIFSFLVKELIIPILYQIQALLSSVIPIAVVLIILYFLLKKK